MKYKSSCHYLSQTNILKFLHNILRLCCSCCVDSVAAMHVQGNAIVHYGHTCFSKANIPVFTVLPKGYLNVEETMKLLHDNFNSDGNDKLCLFYDVEFEHCKGEIVNLNKITWKH